MVTGTRCKLSEKGLAESTCTCADDSIGHQCAEARHMAGARCFQPRDKPEGWSEARARWKNMMLSDEDEWKAEAASLHDLAKKEERNRMASRNRGWRERVRKGMAENGAVKIFRWVKENPPWSRWISAKPGRRRICNIMPI